MSNPVDHLNRAMRASAVAVSMSPEERIRRITEEVSNALTALRGPEPDWSEAPEYPEPGAQWYAVDSNGFARWWKRKPYVRGYSWTCDGTGGWWQAGRVTLPLGTDWRLTLRQRPEGV